MKTQLKTPFADRNPVNRILAQFRQELIAVGIFSMIANLLMLTPTIYMLQVFDRVMVSQNGMTLVSVSLVALFLFLIMAFSEWTRSRLLVRAGVRFDSLINTRVFRSSFEASLQRSGRSPGEAFGDLVNLRQFMTGNGIFAFFDAPWTPIYIAVAWLLHPVLGYAAIVFAVILGVVAWWGHRYTEKANKSSLESVSKEQAFVQSKLRNVESIESMGMLEGLRGRWAELHAKQVADVSYAQERSQRVQSLVKFLQYTQQSLFLGVGALLVVAGELSPGAMIAANILMARALQPVQMLVGTWKGFIAARLSYNRLASILSNYPYPTRSSLVEAPKGRVELANLVATVPSREEPILKDLNAVFEPGELVVIMGPSGSGKSTLARCLLGIWPHFDGNVLLDAMPIRGYDRKELGPYIGYLPQDIELFEGSIAENIARFGALDSQKIIQAAMAAGVHEMILRFPKGYDTPMGIAGGQLSGGQRQRIALARALYGDPTLLVLDEPNANLDDVGEAALLRALQQLKASGKTIFLVTHRGGVLQLADRVLVLQAGEMRTLGAPSEVLPGLAA
jgi:ATP-binding cassette subfamily C exporter for protease/lipase